MERADVFVRRAIRLEAVGKVEAARKNLQSALRAEHNEALARRVGLCGHIAWAARKAGERAEFWAQEAARLERLGEVADALRALDRANSADENAAAMWLRVDGSLAS